MSIYKGVIFSIKIIDKLNYTKVSDIFGYRPRRGREHKGIDLECPIGTAIKTPYNGTVTEVVYDAKKAGNYLTIDHGDGFVTRYLHLDKIFVQKNKKIYQNDTVATSGNTDGGTNISTGPHLHFEVIINGVKQDPAPYLFGYTLFEGENRKFYPNTPIFTKTTVNKFLPDEIKKIVDSEQLHYATIIINKCKELEGSKRDAIIAIEAALVESTLKNLNKGLGSSLGLFQQTKIWGTKAERLNPEISSKLFFTGKTGIKGLFNYKNRDQISTGAAAQQVQDSGYPDRYQLEEEKATKIVDYLWGDIVESYYNEFATEIERENEEIEVNTYLAPGIWQIVKLVIDPEVKDLKINDATISFMQGSLYNFFEKICQKPFVEFWGDTYGDQYYFIVRKPPFTKQSYNSLPTINITDQDVYSDSLRWENDDVYSWFMLEPNGNYIGGNETIYQYLTAVFFPEYAEIWGSKPLSITTNYITFIKETGDIQLKAAEQDLKFVVDIHSYLPFTRKGTITIKGDRRIKRGMRIYYEPTNEYYYVDSVSNSYSVQDGILDRTTTLTVSRGMIKDYCETEIKDNLSLSYFNLINYGSESYNKKPEQKQIATPKNNNPNIDKLIAYFNQDEYVFNYEDIEEGRGLDIDSGNLFLGVNNKNKKELKVNKKVVDSNFENCEKAAKVCFENPGLSFEIVGNTDSFDTQKYNIELGKRRAETVKATIIQKYKELYAPSDGDIANLDFRLEVKTDGESKPSSDNKTPLGRLKNRRVDWYIKEEKKVEKNIESQKTEEVKPAQGINWKVNKEVFMFFLKKQQLGSGIFEL